MGGVLRLSVDPGCGCFRSDLQRCLEPRVSQTRPQHLNEGERERRKERERRNEGEREGGERGLRERKREREREGRREKRGRDRGGGRERDDHNEATTKSKVRK